MKKTALIFILFFVAGLAMTSCKSYETCPAYGKAKSPLGYGMKWK